MRLLLIVLAALFFFLSNCSVVLGILTLFPDHQQGIWFLVGALLCQLMALGLASVAGVSKSKSSPRKVSAT